MIKNEKGISKKSKIVVGSIVFYVAASAVALIAVAFLINNILLFKNMLNQYTTQGYDPAVVMKQLVPSQLLPGIFEPVAVYGGIAVLLVGVGMIYQKIAEFTTLMAKVEDDSTEDTVLEDSAVEMEETEAIEQIEAAEEDGDSI